MNTLTTPREAKRWLKSPGDSGHAFARAHDHDASIWHQILAGRKKGLSGKAHEAALALGI